MSTIEYKHTPYKFAPIGSSQCGWGEGEMGGDKASSHSTMNFKRCGGQN